MSFYTSLIRFSKPYKLYFFLTALLVLIFTTSNIYFMPLIRDLANEISDKDKIHTLNQIFNAILLITIRFGAQFTHEYLTFWISNKINIDIRLVVYKKLLSFSQHYYSENKLGDILSNIFIDVEKFTSGLMATIKDLPSQGLTFIGVFTYLLFLNWKLTLLTVIAVPIFIFLTTNLAKKLKKAIGQAQRKLGDLNHIVQENINNIKLIQASNMEFAEIAKFEKESNRNFTATILGLKVKTRTEFLITYLQYLVFIMVLWFGSLEVVNGNMSSPELLSFFGGIALMIDPIIKIPKVINNLNIAKVSLDRINSILSKPVLIKSSENAIKLEKVKGIIEFKNITFKYEQTEELVLNKLNLTANEGEVVALVGLSGAGKSTLINLIPRFYDPNSGSISIDGTPIKDVDLSSLRQHIAMVPQDDILFRGTIIENIRYGSPNANEDEVIEAAKSANAYEFIQNLKNGIRTNIGDKGNKLSGGQKQRISIARAILRNPKILLLDEATSALDSESEQLVQDALKKLMKNRTTFVIAHRLSTIMHAHKIVVLNKGKIIEVGKHEDLLEKNGAYAKLYNIQYRKNETTKKRK